jgi:thioredoxin 1
MHLLTSFISPSRTVVTPQSRITFLLLLAVLLATSGCDQLSSSAKSEVGGAARESGSDAAVEAKPADSKNVGSVDKSEPLAVPDVDGLHGKGSDDVLAALGKSQGKIQTKSGELWLYPKWRVQFDTEGKVMGVEKDSPIPAVALDPKLFPPATAAAKSATASAPSIRVISNGGQEVKLGELLQMGKVTVVDFYADWCGPCRQVSPYLQRMAAHDADINLIKIDIVQWDTPVARQFDIRSIPNIRVFDRRGGQVGSPTSDLRAVQQNVKTAKL